MKALKILFLSILLLACSDGSFWNDGSYAVYKCCGQNHFSLGYEIDGNGWESLIEHVVSVGSNDNYIIIKSKLSLHFVVEKVKNKEHWRNRDSILRDLTKSEFLELKVKLGLPDFTREFG
jgi:hypothetical protein